MLTDTLDKRLKETVSTPAGSKEKFIPSDILLEANGLHSVCFKRRRFLIRKQWVNLRLGFLHSDELVLVEEDKKRIQAYYRGQSLSEALSEWKKLSSRLLRDGYSSEDAMPTLNSLIPEIASIIRDRNEVKSVLSF
jgi:hypothetical protein